MDWLSLYRRVRPRRATPRRDYPLLNEGLQIRLVGHDEIVDFRWRSYRVWEVRGRDSDDSTVVAGWENFVTSLDFPVQILVRQHNPNLQDIRQQLRNDLPDYMKVPSVENLADSLDDYLAYLETRGGIVDRKFYVIADADREAELSGLLAGSGFVADVMVGQELRDLYVGCGSGMLAGHRQERYQMRERSRYLQLNDRKACVYGVSQWPRNINMDILEKLLRTGEELDISLYIEPMEQREALTRLDTARSRWEGMAQSEVRHGHDPSQENALVLRDIYRLLEEVQMGVSGLYSLNLTVAAYGITDADLKRACDVVESHFKGRQAEARLLLYRQREGLAQLMPALRKGLSRPLYRADTGTLVRTFPFGPPDLDTRQGTLISLCLRSRSPMFYDRFGPGIDNGHTAIVAPTGSGKSFDAKVIVIRETQRGIRNWVIDPSGEYANITRSLGGRVVEPGRPGYGLNPFGVRYTDPSDLREHGAQVCALLEMMLEDKVEMGERSGIDLCVTDWYDDQVARAEGKGALDGAFLGMGGINEFDEYLRGGNQGEAGDRLTMLLRRFVSGTLSDLMGGDGISLMENEAPATSMTLRSISQALMPVATAVCAQAVWSLAVSDSRKRLMLFDEIWMLLQTPAGSKLLMNIIKQARKYDLGVIAITQQLSDFKVRDASQGLAGTGGEAVLANCYTKLLLHHPPDALPAVQEMMGLSPEGTRWLQRAVRGQGLFIVGEESFPVRIVATDAEKELIEDPSWRQRVDRFADNERALVAV